MPHDDAKEKIRRLLAEQIGAEPEDVSDTDSLIHDLHINPEDLSDFLLVLEKSGYKIAPETLVDCETFTDLVELASAQEEIK